MNIGFYRYSLYNRGGDRLIIAYANYLAESGHDVTLYARVINTVFSFSPKLRIRRIPYPTKMGCLLYGAMHRLGHDVVIVDIIHLPAALSLRNRTIYYAQADDREYYDSSLLRSAMDGLYSRYFRGGKYFISMSQHLTDIFAGRYGAVRAITIATGIDHGLFYPEADPALIRQKGGKKALVFMARGDSFRKGHDIAARVFEHLPPAVVEKMELWICGIQSDERNYNLSVKKFGIVTDDRLRQILSSADIFFYPSRHEGFGLFPLEAMACGCVAVTTTAIPYAAQTQGMLVSQVEDVAGLIQNITTLVSDDRAYQKYKHFVRGEAAQYDISKSKCAFESALRQFEKEI